jgi:5-methylcytosine-specific restriction endonuclease McrA
MKYSKETIDKIKSLVSGNYTVTNISKMLNIPYGTVHYYTLWGQKYEKDPKRMKSKSEYAKNNKQRMKDNYNKWYIRNRKHRNAYMNSIFNKRRMILTSNLSKVYSLKEWDDLKEKYNYTCPCCKRKEPEIKLTIDHIIPVILNGDNSIDNLQPLCQSCNSKKGKSIIKYQIYTNE